MVTLFLCDEIASNQTKYQKRLEKFFDSLNIQGTTVEEKSKVFVNLAKKEGSVWVFNNILKFMQFQLDRVNRKEITGSTIRNYLKSIKLFCEMADFTIAWKKISRGLPRTKNYSDDRIPTIEEISKLLEYPALLTLENPISEDVLSIFMIRRKRTSSRDIGYGLYLFFLGLSFRSAAKALSFLHIIKISHRVGTRKEEGMIIY
jgi:hypothetical protein